MVIMPIQIIIYVFYQLVVSQEDHFYLLKIKQRHVLQNVILQTMEIVEHGDVNLNVIQLIMDKILQDNVYQVVQHIHLLLNLKIIYVLLDAHILQKVILLIQLIIYVSKLFLAQLLHQ